MTKKTDELEPGFAKLCRRSKRFKQFCEEWKSPKSRALLQELALIAKHREAVLVLGPTGSGKSRIAECIHELRKGSLDRAPGNFCQLNMAAISPDLVHSELFGYRKGAFTGAVADSHGLILAANGGTLFLDEIADADQGTQAALLTVLDSLYFRPVGQQKEVRVDLDLISATNKDPAEEIAGGMLREDLYYRLARVVVNVPTLSERTLDIPGIASSLVAAIARRYEGDEELMAKTISPAAVKALMKYKGKWAGNVRQLEHVLVGGFVRAGEKDTIELEDLPPEESWQRNTRSAERLHDRWIIEDFLGNLTRDDMMRVYVRSLFAQTGNVKKLVADTAKVAITTVNNWERNWLGPVKPRPKRRSRPRRRASSRKASKD